MSFTRRQFTKAALLSAAMSSSWCTRLAAQAGSQTHIVQRGDTLSRLAIRYGTRVSALKKANGLNSDLLRIGQTGHPTESNPPAPPFNTVHVVQPGETPTSRCATASRERMQANGLRSDLLRINQQLTIPTRDTPRLKNTRGARAATSKIWCDGTTGSASGTPQCDQIRQCQKYDVFHRQRGMQNGLAHHFVIGNGIDSGDGEIEVGPRWSKQLLGGHLKSYRLNSPQSASAWSEILKRHTPARNNWPPSPN